MVIYDVQDLVKIYPGHVQPADDHLTFQVLVDLADLLAAGLPVFWLVVKRMDWRAI